MLRPALLGRMCAGWWQANREPTYVFNFSVLIYKILVVSFVVVKTSDDLVSDTLLQWSEIICGIKRILRFIIAHLPL